MKKSYKPSSKLLNVDILMQTFALNSFALKNRHKFRNKSGIHDGFFTLCRLSKRSENLALAV